MATTRIRLDKQIQKATTERMIPMSDTNGELQYFDAGTIVKGAETLTHLDGVEISGGNLIIKYTAEDGRQQVVSTKLTVSQTDINVSDAKLENPSAGVYRLVITETDGSTYTVDLSALLAVVTQNSEFITWSGNGTPAQPLNIELSEKFWQKVPRVLDDLEDCTVTQSQIDAELSKLDNVLLAWDRLEEQWVPKAVAALDDFKEYTEYFRNLVSGVEVRLSYNIDQLVPQSIKVFRNGLRQDLGEDYSFNPDGKGHNVIAFTEPFTERYAEKVIVDYRPLPRTGRRTV